MRILLATSNPHKLDEIRAVMSDPAIQLLTLADIAPDVPEPVEDQDTFEGNAMLKAKHYAEATGTPCLADDSGLEVDALGGEPGVHSARYSEADGPRHVVDLANNRKLLDRLGDLPPEQRGARFVCVMALVFSPRTPNPVPRTPILVRGTVEGRILMPAECADPGAPERGRGKNGFGYDPLFLIPSLGKTTAELPPAEKNKVSHRGQAARRMWDKMRPMLV